MADAGESAAKFTEQVTALLDHHLQHRNPADLVCRDELVAAMLQLIEAAREDGRATYRKAVVELALYGDEQWVPHSSDGGLTAAIARMG